MDRMTALRSSLLNSWSWIFWSFVNFSKMRRSGVVWSSVESFKVTPSERKFNGLSLDSARTNNNGVEIFALKEQMELQDIFCHCLLVDSVLLFLVFSTQLQLIFNLFFILEKNKNIISATAYVIISIRSRYWKIIFNNSEGKQKIATSFVFSIRTIWVTSKIIQFLNLSSNSCMTSYW